MTDTTTITGAANVALLASAISFRVAHFTKHRATAAAATTREIFSRVDGKAKVQLPKKHLAYALDALFAYNNLPENKAKWRSDRKIYKQAVALETKIRKAAVRVFKNKLGNVLYAIEVASVYEPPKVQYNQAGKSFVDTGLFTLIPPAFAGWARGHINEKYNRYRFNQKEIDYQDLEAEAAFVYSKLRNRYPHYNNSQLMATFQFALKNHLVSLIRKTGKRVHSGEADAYEEDELQILLDSASGDESLEELLARLCVMLDYPGDKDRFKKLFTKKGISVVCQPSRQREGRTNASVNARIDNFVDSPGFADRLRESIMSYSAMWA